MKKVFTLLLALVTLTSAFAQSGHDGWNGSQKKDNRTGASQSEKYGQPAYSYPSTNTSDYNGQQQRNGYYNHQGSQYSYNSKDSRTQMNGWDREHMQKTPEYYNPYVRTNERNRFFNHHGYNRGYDRHYDEYNRW